jgi:hypothetical protein
MSLFACLLLFVYTTPTIAVLLFIQDSHVMLDQSYMQSSHPRENTNGACLTVGTARK